MTDKKTLDLRGIPLQAAQEPTPPEEVPVEGTSFPHDPPDDHTFTRIDLGQSFRWDGKYWKALPFDVEEKEGTVTWHVGRFYLKVSRSLASNKPILEFNEEGRKAVIRYFDSNDAALQQLQQHFGTVPEKIVNFIDPDTPRFAPTKPRG